MAASYNDSYLTGRVEDLERRVEQLQDRLHSLERKIDYECANNDELHRLENRVSTLERQH